jgi:hypothetical protein
MKFRRALQLLICEKNVDSLVSFWQRIYINHHTDAKSYNDLSDFQKESLVHFVDRKKKETVAQVARITSDRTEQSWVYDLLFKDDINLPEDISKVRDALVGFNKVKKSGNFKGKKNILEYNSVSELVKVVNQYSSKDASAIDRKAGEVVYEKNGYLVLKMDDFSKCSAELNRENPNWCVKYQDTFENYGAPFFAVYKDGKKLCLIHFPSGQIKDVDDEPYVIEDDAGFEMLKYLIKKYNINIHNLNNAENKDLFQNTELMDMTSKQRKQYYLAKRFMYVVWMKEDLVEIKQILKDPDFNINQILGDNKGDNYTSLLESVINKLNYTSLPSRIVEIVKLMLENPNIHVNLYGEYDLGPTLLMRLISKNEANYIEIIRLLLAHPSIDINHQARNEDTALIIAAHYNRIAIIKELLKHPKMDLKMNNQGITAIKHSHNDYISDLIKNEMKAQGLEV